MTRTAFCPVVIARFMLIVFCVNCPVCLTAQAEWSLDSPSWYGPTEKGQGDPAEAFDPPEIPVPPLNDHLNNSGSVADVTSAAPEPATWMLLIALFPAFTMRRSRA